MPGIVKCGGTEEDIVVAHGCRKRKKLICGPEEEIVVAYGRMPSPARYRQLTLSSVYTAVKCLIYIIWFVYLFIGIYYYLLSLCLLLVI